MLRAVEAILAPQTVPVKRKEPPTEGQKGVKRMKTGGKTVAPPASACFHTSGNIYASAYFYASGSADTSAHVHTSGSGRSRANEDWRKDRGSIYTSCSLRACSGFHPGPTVMRRELEVLAVVRVPVVSYNPLLL